ncbi:MAG TPA: ABC transporter permease, partial [Calditrichia bacterium]|nr:ABC transporter permease [Calditrichia bacterium]
MIQNLRYYWRLNLLILLGVAVATAVLSGALLVGDAMRGSLRDMTLERLGQIDQVLSADHFFPANLATRIGQDPAPNSAAPQSASLVLVPGNVFPADKKGLAGGVNIIGIGPDFTAFFHNDSLLAKHLPLLTAKSKSAFPTVLINRHLAETLNLGENAELLLSFERHSSLDRESLFGRKEADEVLQFLRVRVAGILPDRHAGRFGLAAAQFVPYNLFMDIGILQEALGVGEGANTILLSGSNGQRQRLNPDSALAPGWLLTDGGLTLKKVEGGYSLESENYILPPAVARKGATVNSPAPPMGILTYLANRMRVGDREIPYSTVSAIDLTCSFAGNRLLGSEGNAVPDIKPGRILLNQWAANALQAAPGDILTLTYYQVGGNDSLAEAKENFTIAGIVRMEELGGDSTLSPTYPGIGDATHIRDWDPPFRMDLERIGPADEAYWDQWKGTPKAFISLAQGQALWGNRFGNLTALRFGTPDGQQDSLHTELFRVLTPADMGFSLFPVRQKGLEGAIGATDFSGLFIGFSFFLIIAAAMLVAMLFRLNLEQRHREIGVLLAAGFSIKTITRRFLGEGAMLAILGGLLGTVLAVGFAQMMVVGLRSVWLGAVGTTFITLHLSWASLLLGLGITVAIMLVTIRISLRQLRKIQVSGLLSGVNELREISAAGKSRIAGMVLLVLALLLAAYGIRSAVLDAALFYATGFLLLWAGLLLTRAAMKGRDRGRPIARPGFLQIAAINLRRKPGRSILAIALVAFATFMIVSVGANRRSFDENDLTRTSGTGGYSLIGKSAVPVFRNLNSEQVRFDMG